MSKKMKKSFSNEMQNMDAAGLLRVEASVVEYGSTQVSFDNNGSSEPRVLNFSSNDFLSWKRNESIREVAQEALTNFGVGSTSSRATLGTHDLLKQLEHKLCEFLGMESCILFPSHYLANVGLCDAFTMVRDSVFIDDLCHPSLIDGARLCRGKAISYASGDYENLEYHLKCSKDARYRLIVSDGVLNSNAQCVDLHRINQLKQGYDAISILDDSLGLGLIGHKGRGTFDYLQADQPEVLSGSFAYGLGNMSGGFVGGDRILIEWLRQCSRPYVVAEPLSPVNASVVLKAIELLESDDAIAESLFFNVSYLREELVANKWDIIDTSSHPLVSIVIGSTLIVQKMVEALFKKGVLVSGICYPNTKEGAAQIRIHVSAQHSKSQLDELVSALNSIKYLTQDVEKLQKY